MNNFISIVISIVLFFTKGVNNRIVYLGFPDFDDMLRGLLPYLNSSEVIILTSDNSLAPSWLNQYNVKIIKKKSLKGFYYLISAKIIYYTHGIYAFYPLVDQSRQKIINLWHGMPLKNIGYLDGKENVPNSHYCLATSDFFADLMSKAFGLPLDKVLVSGLPRNDLLIEETGNSYLLSLKKAYSTIICWLPTYRKSKVGDIRSDGKSNANAEYDWAAINQYCLSQDALLILKPHPMDASVNINTDFSHIMILNEKKINERNTSLYEVLSISDMLWTDYSSVFIDYTLTNKPIIFISPDLNEYKKSRGFAYDINDHPLPGKSFNNIDDVMCFSLNELLSCEGYDKSLYQKNIKFKFEIIK